MIALKESPLFVPVKCCFNRRVKIISGGQTGVDRAALDAALSHAMPVGGWCPRGRRAEDGEIPSRYPLEETNAATYEERTELNVRDSDATLVVSKGLPTGGTAYTIAMAEKWNRPICILDVDHPDRLRETIAWIEQHGIRILNVAGPRESTTPGIHAAAYAILEKLLAQVRA